MNKIKLLSTKSKLESVFTRRSISGLCFAILFLFLYFFCSTNVSRAKEIGCGLYSFDFKNCAISDAVGKVMKATDVNISVNGDADKSVPKANYVNKPIEEILKDLFRKDNCAIVWYYSEGTLDSVGIWIFEGGKSTGNFSSGKFNSETTSKNSFKQVATKDKLRAGKKTSRNTDGSKTVGYQYGTSAAGTKRTVGKSKKPGSQGRTESKTSSITSATSNDNPGIGIQDCNSDIIKKNTVSPLPIPEKWHGLEPPPMPPGFHN